MMFTVRKKGALPLQRRQKIPIAHARPSSAERADRCLAAICLRSRASENGDSRYFARFSRAAAFDRARLNNREMKSNEEDAVCWNIAMTHSF